MAAITDLASASAVNSGDNLVINQSGTDKKISATNLFGAWSSVPTITSGLAIGVAGNKLWRPTAGVVTQQLEWATIANTATLVVRNDTVAYALVHVFSATHGKWATFAVEGNGVTGQTRLVQGDSSLFKTTGSTQIMCFALAGVVYVQNFTGANLVLSVFALL